MSDETKVVSAEKTNMNTTQGVLEESPVFAGRRAEDVAQKKLAELSYAETYRQKLREEKTSRRDTMRQRAEAEQRERREREREERRLRMQALLSSEREAIAERNAGSDAVLTTVGDAERDRLSRREEEKETQARAAEAQATLAAEQAAAEKVAAEQAAAEQAAAEQAAAEKAAAEQAAAEQAAAEKAAAEKAAAEKAAAEQAAAEKAAAEKAAAEQAVAAQAQQAEQARLAREEVARKVAEELRRAKEAEELRRAAEEEERSRVAEETAAAEAAAEQVRQIVEQVEAERAAQARAAEERAAAERAAAEQVAAQARAKAEQEAAEERAAAERAEQERIEAEAAQRAEKDAKEAKEKAEREARRDALYTEASEMAAQRILAAKTEAMRRRGEEGAAGAAPDVSAPKAASRAAVGDDPLRAEREKARELAAERVRADRMADAAGRLAEEDDALTVSEEASAEDAALTAATAAATTAAAATAIAAAPNNDRAADKSAAGFAADGAAYSPVGSYGHRYADGDGYAASSSRSVKKQLAFERREGKRTGRDQRRETRYRQKYGEPSQANYHALSYPAPYVDLRADEEEVSRSAERLQTEQQAWSAKEAVREARVAEKEARRMQRAVGRVAYAPEAEVDYEAERRAVKMAVLTEMPEEPAPLTPETVSAAAVIREEKAAKRALRRARKATRRTLSGKKENKKYEKTVAKKLAKAEQKKDVSGRKINKEIVGAERALAKAERKEARAQKRVDRAQRAVERLQVKQTAMETKHAKRLARRPSLAKKLNQREEALAKEIVKAHKSVDRAAVKEEKREARVYAAQQRLDKLTERQSRMDRRADKKLNRLRRAEDQVARRTERYNNRAEKKLTHAGALDHSAARENMTVYKKELPRSLHTTSSRQLDYEASRVKKGALTEAEAKRTLDAQNNKIPEVLKAEARLSSAERDLRSLDRKTARVQGKLDRMLEKQAQLEERDRQLVERNPSMAPKLLERERAMAKKVAKLQKKVRIAERRQDRFENKHVDPAVRRLEHAESRQQTLYDKQARRLMRAKRRSDRDAYRAKQKTVQRRNLEEKQREKLDYRAVDTAEMGALATRQTNDSRKVRLLKRQVKQARSRERIAARRADRSRRTLDKANAKNTVANHQNERTVERNPKAYNAVLRKTEKERRKIERMERQNERDLRRLEKASQKSDDAIMKLEAALGQQHIANEAVYAMYDRTAERDYIVAEPKEKKQTLREKRREMKRSRAEEREYERLLAAWKREESKAIAEQQEEELSQELDRKRRERRALAATDSVVSTAAYAAAQDTKGLRKTESILASLDRLYDERMQIERKLLRDADSVALTVRLVNLQKQICDEHFELLQKTDAKSDPQALPLADGATAEIRRYNEYVSVLNRLTGTGYAFAKLTTPYRILEGKSYAPIASVTYRGAKAKVRDAIKAERRRTPVYEEVPYEEELSFEAPVIGESLAYDKVPRSSMTAMSNREFSNYVNDILKTNIGISKQRNNLRRQLKSKKHNAVIRTQTEILRLQKEILDNYIRIFSVAYEEGRGRRVKGLVRDCVREIKYFNRELSHLEHMDGTRHVRVSTSLPNHVLAGRAYEEIPSMVCVMPGRVKVLDNGALNDNFTDVDAALIESRYNYRIAALTRSLKDMRYDYILFPGSTRRSKRQKKKLLSRTKSDRKLAIAAEERDNRRYEALVAFEPKEKGRRSRRVDNRRMTILRQDVSRLLARRDELNRELLSLYAMTDDGASMRATERYEDGTMGRGAKLRGRDDPYITAPGYLKHGSKKLSSPDAAFAAVYTKEKRRQYNKSTKYVAAIGKLRLPETHPDVRALFQLYNRRIDLLTTVNTTDKKIRIYGYKGKAAAAVNKERKAAVRELKQIERQIRNHMSRAKNASRRRPKPFWA